MRTEEFKEIVPYFNKSAENVIISMPHEKFVHYRPQMSKVTNYWFVYHVFGRFYGFKYRTKLFQELHMVKNHKIEFKVFYTAALFSD